MEFEIIIKNQVKKIVLERDFEDKDQEVYFGIAGEKNAKLTVRHRQGTKLIISIDGKIYDIRQINRTPYSVHFEINGEDVLASLKGGVEKTDYNGVASVSDLVIANFPARVVKVNFREGELIKEGETIMVLEAMKMEAQIKTPRDCVLEEIFVNEGDMVERGGKLARLGFK